MTKTHPCPIQDSLRLIHIAGGGLCLLILGSASALGVIPAIRAHEFQQGKRFQLTTINSELDQAGDAHVQLLSEIELMRQSIRSRDVVLTPAAQINSLMSELTQRIEALGLTLVTLQAGSIQPGEPTALSKIQLWVEGPLERVIGMIEELDREHPDLHFHELSIEHVGPGTVRMRSAVGWLVGPDQ
jgi:hypothetical protein